MPTLSTEAAAMDTQKRQIEAMFDNRKQRYVCEVCDRQYKTENGLQRHLKDQHQLNITENSGVNLPQEDYDHIPVYSALFMKCVLLLREFKPDGGWQSNFAKLHIADVTVTWGKP